MHIQTRPVTPEDQKFLLELCGTTRARELALTNLDSAERTAFVLHQFQAQTTYYERHYPRANFDLLLHEGRPIGRISVDRRPDELRLMDIALLPRYQNQGIGTRLTRALQDEARRSGRKVTLYVEINNPDAMRFYVRMGFVMVENIQTHDFMEWLPPAA